MQHGVWIEITRGWIDAAIVRRSVVAHCHRHWRADESAPDHSLGEDIEAALRTLGEKPGRVRVLWSAPGVPVDLRPVPVPGEPGLRAVRLAHGAAAGLIPDFDALTAIPLPADGPRSADTTAPLALAAGMSTHLLAEIEAGVRRGGGTLGAVYAAHATVLADTAASAVTGAHERLSVSVSVGEDASAISIATDGRIALARTVDLGASALRPSYEHVIREAGRFDSAGATRSVTSLADELLHTFGVPARAEEMPHGVSGDVVFQMMRPALQRLVFEVKQSIRFTALDTAPSDDGAEVRATLRLVRTPIPNLSALIAHECGAIDATEDPARSAGPGAGIAGAIAAPSALVEMHIPTSQAAKRTTRMRIGAAVGMASALAIVGADAWSARVRALRLEAESSVLQSQLTDVGNIEESDVRVWEASKDASALLSERLAPVAPWAGCMAAVARELGTGVKLTRVSGDRDRAHSTLRFDGEVAAATPAEARDTLLQALARLRASPLFGDVDVPTIDQESRDGGAIIAFTLVATLKESSPTWVAEVSQ